MYSENHCCYLHIWKSIVGWWLLQVNKIIQSTNFLIKKCHVEQVIWHEMHVSFFSTTVVRNILCSNKYWRSYIQDKHRNECLSSVLTKTAVSTNFSRTNQYQISWKSIYLFSCFMCTDGQTKKETTRAILIGFPWSCELANQTAYILHSLKYINSLRTVSLL